MPSESSHSFWLILSAPKLTEALKMEVAPIKHTMMVFMFFR